MAPMSNSESRKREAEQTASDAGDVEALLEAHSLSRADQYGWRCRCGYEGSAEWGNVNHHRAAVIREHYAALTDTHALQERLAQAKREALREAAGWLAQTGYPVQFATPDAPPPTALWDALVDVVHADETGEWHGHELTRDEVDSWLAAEAGETP